VHQRYVADILDSCRAALGSVDPTTYFVKYGANVWAGVKGYLDEVPARRRARDRQVHRCSRGCGR